MPLITLKDLKASETVIARAVRKAATAEKRLSEAKEVVELHRIAHASLVEQYGKQG